MLDYLISMQTIMIGINTVVLLLIGHSTWKVVYYDKRREG